MSFRPFCEPEQPIQWLTQKNDSFTKSNIATSLINLHDFSDFRWVWNKINNKYNINMCPSVLCVSKSNESFIFLEDIVTPFRQPKVRRLEGRTRQESRHRTDFKQEPLRSLPDNMNWHKVVPFLLADSSQRLQADFTDRICDPWAQNRYQMFPLLHLTAKSFTLRYKDSNGSKQTEA